MVVRRLIIIALFFFIIIFNACSEELIDNLNQTSLVTTNGNLISDINNNDWCINLIQGYYTNAPGGYMLYFSSDRNGTNIIYSSAMQSNGLFSREQLINYPSMDGIVPSKYFTIIEKKYISVNTNNDVIVLTRLSDNTINKFHINQSGYLDSVMCNFSQIRGMILGYLPPGANFMYFNVPSTNIALVIAQTNGSGSTEYNRINVYIFDRNFSNEDINSYKNRPIASFPINHEVVYGGGSWIPGTTLGMSTDSFIYSAMNNGRSVFYITDFSGYNMPLSLLSSDGDNASPYFCKGDGKLYLTSSGYSDDTNFNLFRWNQVNLGGGYTPFDGIAPELTVAYPTDNTLGFNNEIFGNIYDNDLSELNIYVSYEVEVLGITSTYYLLQLSNTNYFYLNTSTISGFPTGFEPINFNIYAVDSSSNITPVIRITNVLPPS